MPTIDIDDAWKLIGWMLQVAMTVEWPEEKERNYQGDWSELAKDPSTMKSIFSLEYKCSE